MQNVREFKRKLIEVSHGKIGIQILKLWNLELEFWAQILIVMGTTENCSMKMG